MDCVSRREQTRDTSTLLRIARTIFAAEVRLPVTRRKGPICCQIVFRPPGGSALREGGSLSSLETIVLALARQAAAKCSLQARGQGSGFADTLDEGDAGASGRAAALEALAD